MARISRIILFFVICFVFINNLFATQVGGAVGSEGERSKLVPEESVVRIKDVKEINRANVVVLQALNKITAKSYRYEVAIGDSIEFERLIVEPLFCWKSLPSDIPENKVLMRITENKLDKTKNNIFYGWMFSSSPSVSSMEHPMYDITVVDCKKVDNLEKF